MGIYIQKKRTCSSCSSTKMIGQYSKFKLCVVKERCIQSESGRIKYHRLSFIFDNGVTYEGDEDRFGEQTKKRIAQEINQWWKTNPFNKAFQPIPAAPVQVMVQQPLIQGINNTLNTMPVVRRQVTYVQVQQPV